MKILLNVLFTALVVHSTHACRSGKCDAFCAGEIKDPSKMLTFYSYEALYYFNENFDGDEKFVYLHKGKCAYTGDCSKAKESQICAIPEPGASGCPKTFRNFCEMNKFNCDNPDNEYLYYHDDSCNNLDDATPSKDDCDCLECNDAWQPVCAYPCDLRDAQPATFSNKCWLKSFNCENPDEYLYWHEGSCYTDDGDNECPYYDFEISEVKFNDYFDNHE